MFPLRTSAAVPVIRLSVLVKINEYQKRLVFLRNVAKEKETCIKKLVVPRAYQFTFSNFTSIHLVKVSWKNWGRLHDEFTFEGMSVESRQTPPER